MKEEFKDPKMCIVWVTVSMGVLSYANSWHAFHQEENLSPSPWHWARLGDCLDEQNMWERQCVISKVRRKWTKGLLPVCFGTLAPGAFSGHIRGSDSQGCQVERPQGKRAARVPAVPAPVIGVFPAPQTPYKIKILLRGPRPRPLSETVKTVSQQKWLLLA